MSAQSGTTSDIAPTNVLSSDGNPQSMTPEEKVKADEMYQKREFLANTCKLSLTHAADARRRYDYEWMVRDLFRRGYQFSKYQPNTQTIVLASRQTAKIPVNIVAAQMRSIRNQVTSFRPKYETLPRHATEESRVQSRYSGKLLDYYFDHLNFKKKIKETVTQGLMYSIGGPWQIVYDPVIKEVKVWLVDTFDFFFDPLAEDENECEFMIKAVRRPKDEVIFNKDYEKLARKEITGGESRLAVSEYKQFMLQALKNASQTNRDEAPTVILFEGDFKIHDEKTGKVHIRKVIWTDQNSIPLYWEETDNDEFDYVLYHADLNPKEILGEGWMKHVMPINRVINSLESSVYDYNYKVAKGRIVVDKDSGVRAISNVHGEIISKNKGAEVRAMDMPGLPVATQNQIERMYKYQEDIGGVHDSSLGRVPPGSRSGVMLAEMKQSDSTNQQDLVDGLEDFLEEVGRKMLKKMAKHYTTMQIIKDLGFKGEESKYFAVIGEKAKLTGKNIPGHENQVKVGPDWVDILKLGQDNQVRVTIGSWLGYTKEMMQEKTIKLYQLGVIDQKTFLRLWEFGDIDSIVQETRVENLLKSKLQRPVGPNGEEQQDEYGLAMTENEMMTLEGKDMPVESTDDHIVHIALHQEALGKGNDELVGKHIAIHQMYMGEGAESGERPMVSDLGSQPVEGMMPEDAGRNAEVAAQVPGAPSVPEATLGQANAMGTAQVPGM
jgi:hypothetical protein